MKECNLLVEFKPHRMILGKFLQHFLQPLPSLVYLHEIFMGRDQPHIEHFPGEAEKFSDSPELDWFEGDCHLFFVYPFVFAEFHPLVMHKIFRVYIHILPTLDAEEGLAEIQQTNIEIYKESIGWKVRVSRILQSTS